MTSTQTFHRTFWVRRSNTQHIFKREAVETKVVGCSVRLVAACGASISVRCTADEALEDTLTNCAKCCAKV